MSQPRRSTGPRIQKVSQRESAPDSSAAGTLLKSAADHEDATLCRRAPADSDPRTLIARPVDSEPRTLIAKEAEQPAAMGANEEGPATVLWTKAAVEVRVRGMVTPAEGTPIPKPEPVVRTKLSSQDKAKPVAKVAVRRSTPVPFPPAGSPVPPSASVAPAASPRNTPPSFLPKAAASVMPQLAPATRVETPAPMSPRPAPVPSTSPLASSRPSATPPPPSGLTPMQKLMMQRAQQIHEAQQAAKMAQAPMSPVSRPAMSPPMSQHPMSQHAMPQPMSQHPMSQPMGPYSVHPPMPSSQMPRSMPQHGSISPVAMDPSGVSTSFAPPVQLREKSDVGGTIAKLAAVLVFAAIGFVILRGSIGGSVEAETTQQPAAAAQPVPVLTMQAPPAPPPGQPMAIPSSWMAPTATVVPPSMVNDPSAPAPQTVATTPVAPKKKVVKKAAAAPTTTAPAPAPVDLPNETPEPTPAATPAPTPAPAPVSATATGGGTMKNMPTKTTPKSAGPTATEGDAAQKTLDQAKFETTDSL